jgi:hypothetical protein
VEACSPSSSADAQLKPSPGAGAPPARGSPRRDLSATPPRYVEAGAQIGHGVKANDLERSFLRYIALVWPRHCANAHSSPDADDFVGNLRRLLSPSDRRRRRCRRCFPVAPRVAALPHAAIHCAAVEDRGIEGLPNVGIRQMARYSRPRHHRRGLI